MKSMAMVIALTIPLSASATGIPVPNVPEIAVDGGAPGQVVSQFMEHFMDPLAMSIFSTAFHNAMYSLSFLVGVAFIAVSLFCLFVDSVTNRVAGLGEALMIGGAGLAVPGLFQMLMLLFEAGAEVPTWLPLFVNVLFPLVGCGFAIYGLCQYKRAKCNQVEASN